MVCEQKFKEKWLKSRGTVFFNCNGNKRYLAVCYRFYKILMSLPLKNEREEPVIDREPFGANRSDIFPVSVPVRPVPVPVIATVDPKPSKIRHLSYRLFDWNSGINKRICVEKLYFSEK